MSAEAREQVGRAKKIGVRAGLVSASLLAGLCITEIGFRAARGVPWYERLVDEQTSDVVRPRRVGSLMFPLRASLDQSPKRAEEYRVLFLGDSFTYGSGIADASRTFVGLVEQRLNTAQPLPDKREYRVFNGGIPGSQVRNWEILFKQALETFEPDLVIAVFFLRDGVAGVTSLAQIRKIRDEMAELRRASWLFRYSYVYRFFREGYELRRLSDEYLGRIRDGYFGDSPRQTREWKLARAGLLSINRQTLSHGAIFATVVFPILIELDEDYPLADVCAEVEVLCRAHDIPVISLLPAFMHKHAPSLWISAVDQHPNERAHALAAEAIHGFVEHLIRSDEALSGMGPPGEGVLPARAGRATPP